MGLAPGQRVIDRDDDDPDLAVVVHCPDATIEETSVTGADSAERTVAADNPAYDATESAVIVAFVESGLEQDWPAWRDSPAADLYDGVREHGVKCYTFPEARLSPVNTEDAPAEPADTLVELDALQTRLADAEWSLTQADDGTVIAEKRGEQYRISPTGDVDGDGQLREPLENLVTHYRL
ncbi:hypothetical protein [Natrinema sp. 1APR25-10V2]|uniref:hypothetical protein n=1 Tax=Natrinema sp. 1APR25-10V2 TaxID=2951081 RepID=UPI002875C83D|nr:hypothetical protein [Natrinema sp. 1APR25-10V2]MDS0476929.1 hypothetical protein [Natrinema sp. 1APR25-10V2]